MTQTQRNKGSSAFYADLLIILLEIFSIICVLHRGFSLSYLQFYTNLSNYFALIVCSLSAIFYLRFIKTGKAIPEAIHSLKFMATLCLTVTFLVVALIFGPMTGSLRGTWTMLWEHELKFRHLLCPLVMLADNLFLEKQSPLPRYAVRLAALPTLLYAVVSVTLNILRIWEGPYPFLLVYRQPIFMSVIWFILIVCGAYLIGLLLAKLRR